MTEMLATVEVQTGPKPVASVIWLHGLGADGHDFEPIVPELHLPTELPLRFVFPHAPVRPVTLNNGYPMRAWFDIVKIGLHQPRDLAGMEVSRAAVETLIAREQERGIPAARIVLAGFSQGGALALYTGLQHPGKLAGIMALSTYLPLGEGLDIKIAAVNALTPIFYGHGTQDPVVPLQLGEYTRNWLTQQGCMVNWHSYPMLHSVSAEEIVHIRAWLISVLTSG
ncbi:MAG TPA: dienelactone hydrolase family protein [Gammaproteobacteria bacterium]|jgi:phospholipase/carboxylesterase|nr:dienelactone hydrolase family protein [Gammaproteobacteria bacterium]